MFGFFFGQKNPKLLIERCLGECWPIASDVRGAVYQLIMATLSQLMSVIAYGEKHR